MVLNINLTSITGSLNRYLKEKSYKLVMSPDTHPKVKIERWVEDIVTSNLDQLKTFFCLSRHTYENYLERIMILPEFQLRKPNADRKPVEVDTMLMVLCDPALLTKYHGWVPYF